MISQLARLAVCAAALSSAANLAHADCYRVYRGNQALYSSTNTPVDMSRPLSESVAREFGSGATLVFNRENDCPSFDLRVPGPSPVLSDTAIGSSSTTPRSAARGRRGASGGDAPADLSNVFNGSQYTSPPGADVGGNAAATSRMLEDNRARPRSQPRMSP